MYFDDVALVAARRSAVGKFLGAFKSMQASDLGGAVIKAILEGLALEPGLVAEVIMGQVLTSGSGQNPSRQAAVKAGLPYSVPAFGVDQVCGSGLKSVALAAQTVQLQPDAVVIAGGQENMSLSPHCAYVRSGKKVGDLQLIDTMVHDGLTDAFNLYHMGITAENLAIKYQISRREQDEFAAKSHVKAHLAQKAGAFVEEIVKVESCEQDECIRPDTTCESLATLKPAFQKDGTVTPGNASSINDGAAAVAVMSAKEAKRRGQPILARIISYAQAGLDPKIMGEGPVDAVLKALKIANWKLEQLDCIESNEAFAVQSIAVNHELGWDESKVNISGGAIALGHPIGASGARCLTTLVHNMIRKDLAKGIVTLCIGGGMGIAMCVQRFTEDGS